MNERQISTMLLLCLMLAHHRPVESVLVSNQKPVLLWLNRFSDAQWRCIQYLLQQNRSNEYSHYLHDDDVRASSPFYIEPNPKQARPTHTYALTNAKKQIYYLNIFKQMYLPIIVFCFQHLEELYVQSTSFVIFHHELPHIIEVLAETLVNLEISDTPINRLSKQIGKLRKLQKLKLSNTALPLLPDSIGDLSALKFLFLPDNQLSYLPATMKNLRSIEQIILTNNPHLHSIEPLTALPLLGVLQAENCAIEYLPQHLPRLHDLYLSKNNLRNLIGIETLGNGTDHRKSFYLDKNSIGFIPSNIHFVPNLYLLNLNHNHLTMVPLSIFNIHTLAKLYIKSNNFSAKDLEEITKIFNRTNPNLTFIS